jgi:hypothetical protein
MPLQMIGRPVLRKQTGYSLYRPSAHVIAHTLAVRVLYSCRVPHALYFPFTGSSLLSSPCAHFRYYHIFHGASLMESWSVLHLPSNQLHGIHDSARVLSHAWSSLHQLLQCFSVGHILHPNYSTGLVSTSTFLRLCNSCFS